MKISIIIPIYNSEKYLKQCLESLKFQDYKNFEVIMINDGSTDSSQNICKLFSKNDDRFKLYNQKNSGVSKSRNSGLRKATGDIIMFVDSDDYLEQNAFSIIVKQLDRNDILCFAYNIIYKDKVQKIVLKNTTIREEIYKNIYYNNSIGGYLWNKVFRLDIIRKNKLQFNENIHFCEDLLFVCQYLKFCKNLYYFNKPLYNYRMRKSSVSFDFYNKKNISILNSFEFLAKLNKNDLNLYNEFCYKYLINYYKFKKIIKRSKFNMNSSILKLENKVVRQRSIKDKIRFYILKYFNNLYIIIRKYKNSKLKLYD